MRKFDKNCQADKQKKRKKEKPKFKKKGAKVITIANEFPKIKSTTFFFMNF